MLKAGTKGPKEFPETTKDRDEVEWMRWMKEKPFVAVFLLALSFSFNRSKALPFPPF